MPDQCEQRLRGDQPLTDDEATYPTAFWKSPFFSFFRLAPETALTSLITLVDFCTERWVAEVMKGHAGEAPKVTLQFADGSNKTFLG